MRRRSESENDRNGHSPGERRASSNEQARPVMHRKFYQTCGPRHTNRFCALLGEASGLAVAVLAANYLSNDEYVPRFAMSMATIVVLTVGSFGATFKYRAEEGFSGANGWSTLGTPVCFALYHIAWGLFWGGQYALAANNYYNQELTDQVNANVTLSDWSSSNTCHCIDESKRSTYETVVTFIYLVGTFLLAWSTKYSVYRWIQKPAQEKIKEKQQVELSEKEQKAVSGVGSPAGEVNRFGSAITHSPATGRLRAGMFGSRCEEEEVNEIKTNLVSDEGMIGQDVDFSAGESELQQHIDLIRSELEALREYAERDIIENEWVEEMYNGFAKIEGNLSAETVDASQRGGVNYYVV